MTETDTTTDPETYDIHARFKEDPGETFLDACHDFFDNFMTTYEDDAGLVQLHDRVACDGVTQVRLRVTLDLAWPPWPV